MKQSDLLRTFVDCHSTDGAVFNSDGYQSNWSIKASEAGAMPMSSLPAFLRLLLVSDGTVTKSMEAFFWEPVSVEKQLLKRISAELAIPSLGVAPGDDLLISEVKIKGQNSQNIYENATSVVRLNSVPQSFRDQLINQGVGLGILIRRQRLETYREILEIHADKQSARNFGIELDEDIKVIVRTYRIMMQGKPAMMIRESFALQCFE